MTYKQKLLDPRWQRKRLKIMERDNFSCTVCKSNKNTLHVHHKKYKGNPWDIDDKNLVTLCHKCHKKEHSVKTINPTYKLLNTVRKEIIFRRVNEDFLINESNGLSKEIRAAFIRLLDCELGDEINAPNARFQFNYYCYQEAINITVFDRFYGIPHFRFNSK